MKLSAIRIACASLVALIGISTAAAQEFFDTSYPARAITFGVRLGINSSNPTNNFGKVYPNMNKCFTEWGAGFNTGIVVNLNIRNYLSIQPGLLFQNKSNDYTLIRANASEGTLSNLYTHSRYYYFQVPVLASFRFNITEKSKLLAEVGPYFSFGLGGDTRFESIETLVGDGASQLKYVRFKEDYFMESGRVVRHKSFDWGFKFGLGVQAFEHYSFAIHYNAGCRNIANPLSAGAKPSVKNREWSFTVGYDF